jgi:hypothetical protein
MVAEIVAHMGQIVALKAYETERAAGLDQPRPAALFCGCRYSGV